MQSTIAEKGVVEVCYSCNICPYGCTLTVRMKEGTKPFMHQHSCHYFPSLTPAWKKER